jgi:hypothetical protein
MQDWKRLYEAVVLETDKTRLSTLIEETETAILSRLHQLRQSPEGVTERRDIWKTATALNALRAKRLETR